MCGFSMNGSMEFRSHVVTSEISSLQVLKVELFSLGLCAIIPKGFLNPVSKVIALIVVACF